MLPYMRSHPYFLPWFLGVFNIRVSAIHMERGPICGWATYWKCSKMVDYQRLGSFADWTLMTVARFFQSSHLIYNHNYNDQLSTKSDYTTFQIMPRIGENRGIPNNKPQIGAGSLLWILLGVLVGWQRRQEGQRTKGSGSGRVESSAWAPGAQQIWLGPRGADDFWLRCPFGKI